MSEKILYDWRGKGDSEYIYYGLSYINDTSRNSVKRIGFSILEGAELEVKEFKIDTQIAPIT